MGMRHLCVATACAAGLAACGGGASDVVDDGVMVITPSAVDAALETDLAEGQLPLCADALGLDEAKQHTNCRLDPPAGSDEPVIQVLWQERFPDRDQRVEYVTFIALGEDGAPIQRVATTNYEHPGYPYRADLNGDGLSEVVVPVKDDGTNESIELWTWQADETRLYPMGTLYGLQATMDEDGVFAVAYREAPTQYRLDFKGIKGGRFLDIGRGQVTAEDENGTGRACSFRPFPAMTDFVDLDQEAAQARFCAHPIAQVLTGR